MPVHDATIPHADGVHLSRAAEALALEAHPCGGSIDRLVRSCGLAGRSVGGRWSVVGRPEVGLSDGLRRWIAPDRFGVRRGCELRLAMDG